jgi:hypothetical protein
LKTALPLKTLHLSRQHLKEATLVCRLCQEEHTLKQSHIVPEFLYKPLYQKGRRFFFALSTDKNRGNQILQKGLREELLCAKCETILSVYEKYVSELPIGQLVQKAILKNMRMATLKVDYDLFRLFALSILWRASVSSLPFFGSVKLNPVEEEHLRSMLIHEDPGEPHFYGVFLTVPLSGGQPIHDRMLSPDFVISEGTVIFRFLMAGVVWVFCRQRTGGQQPGFSNLYLQTHGNLHVTLMEESMLPMIQTPAESLRSSGKIRSAMEYLQRPSRTSNEKKPRTRKKR